METLLANPQLTLTDYTGTQLETEVLLTRIARLAFCVTNQTGHFVEVNDAYTQLYGYSREELIGSHFSMVLPEEFRAYATGVHNDFIAGAVEMPNEWTVMNKAGRLIRIQAEAIRVEEDNDPPSKLTVIDVLEYVS